MVTHGYMHMLCNTRMSHAFTRVLYHDRMGLGHKQDGVIKDKTILRKIIIVSK